MPEAGSRTLWALAESLGVVPGQIRRTSHAGKLIDQWWTTPRVFGCDHARGGGEWFVLAPDPHIWCPRCARHLIRAHLPNVCAGCGVTFTPDSAPGLVVAEDNTVKYFVRYCEPCDTTMNAEVLA